MGPHYWASDLIKIAVGVLVLAFGIRLLVSVLTAGAPVLIPLIVVVTITAFAVQRYRQSDRW